MVGKSALLSNRLRRHPLTPSKTQRSLQDLRLRRKTQRIEQPWMVTTTQRRSGCPRYAVQAVLAGDPKDFVDAKDGAT